MEAAQSTQELERIRGGAGYSRHRPESTLLYQIVERHYPKFLEAPRESLRAYLRMSATQCNPAVFETQNLKAQPVAVCSDGLGCVRRCV